MLEITGLKASVAGKGAILQGVDLSVPSGEVHAIMGPNGSGKSTMSNVLSGHSDYEVDTGSVQFLGQDLLVQNPEDRAVSGVFMAFQYPVSLPGVSVLLFLQTILNHQRKQRGESLFDAFEVIQQAELACDMVGLPKAFLQRSLNDGFSGGEKKRCEILQMLLLKPKLMILDETDSGLDIDALKMVGRAVELLRSPERSFLVVTHYQRLLDHVVPDQVHVMMSGRIVRSGDAALAQRLEKEGYQWLSKQ